MIRVDMNTSQGTSTTTIGAFGTNELITMCYDRYMVYNVGRADICDDHVGCHIFSSVTVISLRFGMAVIDCFSLFNIKIRSII